MEKTPTNPSEILTDMDNETAMRLNQHREDIVQDINKIRAKCKKMRNSGRLCKYCVFWIENKCQWIDKYYPILFEQDFSKFEK